MLLKSLREQRVQLRMLVGQAVRLLEKILGDDGEKLGLVGGAVVVDVGLAGPDKLNFVVHQLGPGLAQRGWQGGLGHAINHAVGLIEQMREFVDAHVAAVLGAGKALAQSGFREAHVVVVLEALHRAQQYAGQRFHLLIGALLQLPGVGHDEHLAQVAVFPVREAKGRNNGRGRHQQPGQLIDFGLHSRDSGAGQKQLRLPLEAGFLVGGQAVIKGHVRHQQLAPLGRKGPGQSGGSPAGVGGGVAVVGQ